jgi:hypothetical protein
MSRSNDRRLRGHAARVRAFKRGQRRAYGRNRIAVDIEDERKESRARAHRMGPTVEEGLLDCETDPHPNELVKDCPCVDCSHLTLRRAVSDREAAAIWADDAPPADMPPRE